MVWIEEIEEKNNLDNPDMVWQGFSDRCRISCKAPVEPIIVVGCPWYFLSLANLPLKLPRLDYSKLQLYEETLLC